MALLASILAPVRGCRLRRQVGLGRVAVWYYLALSDSQMAAAAPLIKPGRSVLLWVSPRGQVGDLEPADPIRDAG